MELVRVFQAVPFVRTGRQEVIVTLPLVVTCVEEVLKVLEAHCVHGVALLLRRHADDEAEE